MRRFILTDEPHHAFDKLLAMEVPAFISSESCPPMDRSKLLSGQLDNWSKVIHDGCCVHVHFESELGGTEAGPFSVRVSGNRDRDVEYYATIQEALKAKDALVHYYKYGQKHEDNLKWLRERMKA